MFDCWCLDVCGSSLRISTAARDFARLRANAILDGRQWFAGSLVQKREPLVEIWAIGQSLGVTRPVGRDDRSAAGVVLVMYVRIGYDPIVLARTDHIVARLH